MAAAALAAAEIWHLRGGARQQVSVDMLHAAQECRSYFRINGVTLDPHDPITGAYRCGDGGWVRIHANFPHHRDGALAPACWRRHPAPPSERALARWTAVDFEQAAADAGMVVAAMRSFDEWDHHPQARPFAQPLFTLERIGEADPRPLPKRDARSRTSACST